MQKIMWLLAVSAIGAGVAAWAAPAPRAETGVKAKRVTPATGGEAR